MADNSDFSDLARATLTGLPILQRGRARMIALSRDGARGFVVDRDGSLVFFDPQNGIRAATDDTSALGVRVIATRKDAFLDAAPPFAGCTLSTDEETLYVTAKEDIIALPAINQVQTREKARVLNIRKTCGGGSKWHLRESVHSLDGFLYVVGHPPRPEKINQGMEIRRISLTGGNPSSCEHIAGNGNVSVGWRDGTGDRALFTRPHQMISFRGKTSPGLELLLTDIDNRAIRRVSVHESGSPWIVSTVPYDNRHLFTKLWGGRNSGSQHLQTTLMKPVSVASMSVKRTSMHNAEDSAEVCARRHETLCPPEALRGEDLLGQMRGSIIWTNQDCFSCWLHWPGECPAPTKSDSGAVRFNARWGFGYRMVAHFSADEIRFECVRANKEIQVQHLCCAPTNASNFFAGLYDATMNNSHPDTMITSTGVAHDSGIFLHEEHNVTMNNSYPDFITNTGVAYDRGTLMHVVLVLVFLLLMFCSFTVALVLKVRSISKYSYKIMAIDDTLEPTSGVGNIIQPQV